LASTETLREQAIQTPAEGAAIHPTLPRQDPAINLAVGAIYISRRSCTELEQEFTTGSRALVLSDVGGIDLDDEAASTLPIPELEAMLTTSLRAIADLGVGHDDPKLDNFRLVGDKIMVIDFDSSDTFEDVDAEVVARSEARMLSRWYHDTHELDGPHPSPWL
jgi:hypothetical protein